ncbi:signal transduction histidine kinase [Pseudoduganella lurida]|uniref:histidine kinase n=1 Tax=Pseudoduganella lurida TaxID=1036180 RepID=A0A562REC5_9BURK|nr:HAMP domain-containing sensor histidine kinase [Pseudoduganella lurida]TWI67411.1 signal transduction histidine kinase [Pseudoduganella lurida]
MTDSTSSLWRTYSLQRKIGALFALFMVVLMLGLTIQGTLSQQMIVHPMWRDLLQSATARYLAGGRAASLPASGPLRGWRIEESAVPADMPAFFATLAPGYYDEEQTDPHERERSHAVLVTRDGTARVVMAIDITDLEDYQNRISLASVLVALVSAAMIGGSLLWLYRSMRGPIRLLAQRMDELDPAQPAQRLRTDFTLVELHDIAVGANRHLDRVERFIERERTLLDQASHEFRTPVAVIAGAVDVLRLHPLPAAAEAPLSRIANAADNLAEIMSALLYLSREPDGRVLTETTRLDTLVTVLVEDHQHLLERKEVRFVVGRLDPLSLACPEALVRIVVGNLLRNAAENSFRGTIAVTLADRRLAIQDSGSGFDTVAAARRYTQALRGSTRLGGGQGLGLFLTRRVCERFGWTLAIASDPARGTLVEMQFPAPD